MEVTDDQSGEHEQRTLKLFNRVDDYMDSHCSIITAREKSPHPWIKTCASLFAIGKRMFTHIQIYAAI